MLKNNKKYNLEIIIPAYNAHKTIINTLDSILVQQNMKNFHVTIVNDYGKNYKEILKKYKDKMPIKEITTSRNVGPGLARQLGIDNSNSKYIVFIYADDTFYDELSLSTLSEEIKKIALIGPMSDEHEIIGFWACRGKSEESITIAEGIKNLLPDAEVTIVKGCGNQWDDEDCTGFAEAIEAF